jgi:predicted esterase
LLEQANKQTPIFMGHGTEDEVVAHKWGKVSAERLESLGFKVTFTSYPKLGHSASNEELAHVLSFIKARL